jgi:hypothetical protein
MGFRIADPLSCSRQSGASQELFEQVAQHKPQGNTHPGCKYPASWGYKLDTYSGISVATHRGHIPDCTSYYHMNLKML